LDALFKLKGIVRAANIFGYRYDRDIGMLPLDVRNAFCTTRGRPSWLSRKFKRILEEADLLIPDKNGLTPRQLTLPVESHEYPF